MSRISWGTATALIPVFLAISLSAHAGEATVTRGDFAIRFERHARVQSASKQSQRYEPEVFSGRLQLAAPARGPGVVASGDVLIELSGKEFDEQLEDVRTLSAESERRLEILRTERRVAAESAQNGLDRAEFAAAIAERTLRLFREFDSAKMLDQRELGLQWQSDSLKDEKEELAQLEKMYGGTSLANETKDIVLERARRSLARSERQLGHSQRDYKTFVEFLHPQEAKRIEDSARFAAFDLQAARIGVQLATARTELDLAGAERGLRDAKRRAERLEKDHERLVIRASGAGYWVPQVRDDGDTIQPWQSLGEVTDLSSLRLRGTLDPQAILVLAGDAALETTALIGTKLDVLFPARLALSVKATLSELVVVGATDGDSTSFAFLAQLPESAHTDGAMIGLDAIVHGTRTLAATLSVPDKAIKGAPLRPTVRVIGADGEKEVPVRIGPSSDGRTVILDGLTEGDRVVVPDA